MHIFGNNLSLISKNTKDGYLPSKMEVFMTISKNLGSFSELSENEKFLINGGDSAHPYLEKLGNDLIAKGEQNRKVGNDAGSAGAVIKTVTNKGLGDLPGAALTAWGCLQQAAGSLLVFIAKNDSGDVKGAMDRYYEHH